MTIVELPEIAGSQRGRESAAEQQPTPARRASLLRDISHQLSHSRSKTIDRDVCGSMGSIAKLFEADLCFVFRFSDDGKIFTRSHTWLSSGVEDPGDGLRSLPCSLFQWGKRRLRRLESIFSDDLDSLPFQADSERRIARSLGIRSFALAPMIHGRSRIGFLAIASTKENQPLSREILDTIEPAAAMIAAAMSRIRLEETLMHSRRNLHNLLDNFDDYLFILDSAGRVLHSCTAVDSDLGYSWEELRSMTLAELFRLQRPGELNRALVDHAAGKHPALMHPLVARCGKQISVETKITRSTWNNQEVFLAICRDVTERDKAVAGQDAARKRTTSILSAIPDAMIRINRSGFIVESNHSEPPSGIVLPLDVQRSIASACRKAVRTTLTEGTTQVVEAEIPLPGGARTFETRLVVIDDDEVLAIVRDISEQAQLEQMKADFINRASHELRTPLTTALLMVDLIRDGGSDDEVQEYWDVLRLELQRQHELVEDLLTVGRLETGRFEVNLEPLDLWKELETVVDNVRRGANARQVQLHLTGNDQLPQVLGDSLGIERVFTNLLENAVKFTPAGGVVHVSAELGDDGVTVTVKDNGIGIPPEEIPRLFDRFVRASNAVKAEVPGTGVGLFIVKSIVEAHGGEVSVSSQVDRGAEFRVTLTPAEAPVTDEVDEAIQSSEDRAPFSTQIRTGSIPPASQAASPGESIT